MLNRLVETRNGRNGLILRWREIEGEELVEEQRTEERRKAGLGLGPDRAAEGGESEGAAAVAAIVVFGA